MRAKTATRSREEGTEAGWARREGEAGVARRSGERPEEECLVAVVVDSGRHGRVSRTLSSVCLLCFTLLLTPGFF